MDPWYHQFTNGVWPEAADIYNSICVGVTARVVMAPGAVVFFVRIVPIHFLAGCLKRRLNQGYFRFVTFSFGVFLCISLGFLYLSWLL